MKPKRSDIARVNRFALIGWVTILIVIALAYILEVIKGERTIIYYLIVLVCAFVPYIIGLIMYKKNPDNKSLAYAVTIGYSILYAYVLLTGDTPLTFVYLFPILAVMLAYNDFKIMRLFFIINVLINIASVVIKIVVMHATSADDIANYEIQVLALIIVAIFCCLAIRITQQISEAKMATIEGAKVLGLDKEIGTIEVGKKADLIFIKTDKLHLVPDNDICTNIVYSANGADVDTVIIDGNVIMQNRKILNLDEKMVMKNVKQIAKKLL